MSSAPKPEEERLKKDMPLGWRLSLHVAIIGAILCITVVFALMPFQYGRVEQESISDAKLIAEAVSFAYDRLGNSEPHEHARRLLLRIARTPHIFLINVADQEGVVRYSTDSRELGKHYDLRQGVVHEDNILQVTYAVAKPSSDLGGVTVFIDRHEMLANTHKLFAQIAVGIFVIIFVLSFLVKGLLESLVSSRLRRLMGVLENAEQGSFLVRAEVDRRDEIGHLAIGLNQLLGVITEIEAGYLEREHGQRNDQAQKNMLKRLEDTLVKLERSNEKLKRKVKAQELLMEAAHRLGGTLKREVVVERLLGLVKDKLQWPKFAFFLHDNRQERLIMKLMGFFGLPVHAIELNQRMEAGEGIAGLALQTGTPVLVGNLSDAKVHKVWKLQGSPVNTDELVEKIGSVLAVPFLHKGKVIGVFVALDDHSHAFDEEDLTLLNALGAQVALAVVNAELYETTLELATSDPLTGVMNRRAMVKQIEFELARANRFDTSMAILLIDVDHFKSYNDRMGHVLGDQALKALAQSLKENVRKVDTVARFGGEEFCVILPQTDKEGAEIVAQKICDGVRNVKLTGVEQQELGHLSVSVGIAVATGKEEEDDEENAVTKIIAMADEALYEAKRRGRDRFVVYRP